MDEKKYPSDLIRKQFKNIKALLESAKKRTKPREVDLFEVFNAYLYVLTSGCQWRMLPKDYPKWQTVYRYFTIWKATINKDKESILDRALKKMVEEARAKQAHPTRTSFLIVDAQSVKNTDTAEQRGYDAGKKVSGIKRHLFVDTQGLSHAIGITTAQVSDRNGAIEVLKSSKDHLSGVKTILTDGGYSGVGFAQEVRKIIPATVEVAKRNKLHQFVVIPKRWVVERSFAWLQKYRRLWKNCERKLNTSLAMMQFAFLAILLRRS